MAENFYKIDKLENAKKIYKNLSKRGEAFKWYSTKQLARIHVKEKNKAEAIKLTGSIYKDLKYREVYETFDFAEFMKNNEKFTIRGSFHFPDTLDDEEQKK